MGIYRNNTYICQSVVNKTNRFHDALWANLFFFLKFRTKHDVVVFKLNNNTTRNSANYCRIVSILRVSIYIDCIGCIY
jgi:hypothetical protein